jgi:hypothetical protein
MELRFRENHGNLVQDLSARRDYQSHPLADHEQASLNWLSDACSF